MSDKINNCFDRVVDCQKFYTDSCVNMAHRLVSRICVHSSGDLGLTCILTTYCHWQLKRRDQRGGVLFGVSN